MNNRDPDFTACCRVNNIIKALWRNPETAIRGHQTPVCVISSCMDKDTGPAPLYSRQSVPYSASRVMWPLPYLLLSRAYMVALTGA